MKQYRKNDRRADPDSLHQKRSLGQVFLRTEWPIQRMVERLQSLNVDRVLEIGPGGGVLTRGLVAAGLEVLAVEKDDRFAERLRLWAETLPPEQASRFSVQNADILRYDWQPWLEGGSGRAAVVGNIPYNISSPILLKAINSLDRLTAILFMTQLEFACRVSARPNTKDYGSLTVFTQLRAETSLEFKVERTCFQPVPKVDSAVMLVTPKREKLDEAMLRQAEQVTRVAFTQRRKKLRNSVRPFLEALGTEEGCPIELDRRADSLSPEEWVQLAKFLLPA